MKKPLIQSSMLHDFSEIILIFRFSAQEPFQFNIFAWNPLYIFSCSHISFSCSDAYINICWRKQTVSFSASKLIFEDLERVSFNTSIIRSEICESNSVAAIGDILQVGHTRWRQKPYGKESPRAEDYINTHVCAMDGKRVMDLWHLLSCRLLNVFVLNTICHCTKDVQEVEFTMGLK